VLSGLFILLLGFFPLFNSLNNPRTQALHGVDRVQLIAVGFCFGVGFFRTLTGYFGRDGR
jgi:hypothetical protein